MEQVQGDDDEEEDIIEDDAGGAGDEELLYEETSRLETSQDTSVMNILQPQIDPLEWKTELERVGPKLITGGTVGGNEWRAHVDQSVRGREQVSKLMSVSKTDLNALSKQVTEELNQMRLKEKYLNNQYNTVCLEYVEVKHKLEELEKKSSSSGEIVSKLNAELAEITEKLDDLKESFESKDSGMHDTSPLVKIKAALQQLKEEIHTYDMRIGVVSNSLLSARVGDHTRQRVKALHAAKRRQNKGKKTSSDDHSVGSDDN
ncbi:hypothetical protein EON65_06235 [archaeon]|nr:MAG: hypothetical protein EON65_06235 [archaeon]